MRPEIIFYYRGMIERGKNYDWKEGFSANGENGSILYPWATKEECKKEARLQGKKAIFVYE